MHAPTATSTSTSTSTAATATTASKGEQTVTIEITVAGDTRPVRVAWWANDAQHRGTTAPVFTGQIGRGTKRHQCRAWLFEMDRDTARRFGYSAQNYREASNGRRYAIKLADTILNRPCRITGWADAQPHSSRHIMERATYDRRQA